MIGFVKNYLFQVGRIFRNFCIGLACKPIYNIDYRCADEKKVGELRGDVGAIR
jgi:hypothetical protein